MKYDNFSEFFPRKLLLGPVYWFESQRGSSKGRRELCWKLARVVVVIMFTSPTGRRHGAWFHKHKVEPKNVKLYPTWDTLRYIPASSVSPGGYFPQNNPYITLSSSWARWRLNLKIVYSTVYSCADQGKHQSSASLAFVRGIHRWPVNSLHKGPVTRKMFAFDDVTMGSSWRALDFAQERCFLPWWKNGLPGV